MNTSEVLEGVRDVMPNLTVQKLGRWRDKGYLGTPTREGLGRGEGLSENYWPADTVERIKIIAEVSGERVTDKAVLALIGKGYFVGAAGLKAAMKSLIDECDKSAKFGADGYIPSKPYALVNENTFTLMNVIATGLTTPRQFFPYIDADDAHHEALGYECNTPKLGFTRLIDCFSLDNLSQYLHTASDLEIEQAFNYAADSFNLLCPKIAHYLGREGYPTVTTGFDEFLKRAVNTQLPDMPRYEFDCMIRLMCTLGHLAIARSTETIIKILPGVLTGMVVMVIPKTSAYMIDKLNTHHTSKVRAMLKIVGCTHETTDRLEA